MNRHLVRGLALWLAGSILLRLAPGRFLRTGGTVWVVILYAVTFAFMFLILGRRVARSLPPAEAPLALVSLVLPTLVLDAFSSAFFPSVFPNLPAAAAGVFGGWMLICCGGVLAGALVAR